jgi:hypothetical protein
MLSLWGGALDGDIVGGKLGASVYKEPLDRDELTQDGDIAGIVHPIPDLVHCHSNREQVYVSVVANRDVYSMRLWSGTIAIERSARDKDDAFREWGSRGAAVMIWHRLDWKRKDRRHVLCLSSQWTTHEASPFSGHGETSGRAAKQSLSSVWKNSCLEEGSR